MISVMTYMSTDKNKGTWSINRDRHVPPKSSFWYACFRDSDGRRVRRSTKTEDETLAQEIAMKWAQLAQAGRAGRLTESQCRSVIAEMYERAVGQPLRFTTVRSHMAEWLANSKPNTTLVTYRRYQQIIDSFLSHLGIKADQLLREITSADIRSWRDALKSRGLSATTCNLAIKVLRMPFGAAHSNGLIDLNPLTKTSVRLLKDQARVAKDCFTPQQISDLITAAPSEDLQGAIIAGYTTGLRLTDVTGLVWRDVDLAAAVISVTTRKTGKHVIIPIHPMFARWLKKQTRGIGKAPVFPSLHAKSSSGRGGLSMQFRRIMDKAGVKGRVLREASGSGRTQLSLSYHSLRHSFVSALRAAGVSLEARQELVGHSSAEMSKLYTHASIETLRQTIALLPAIPKARAR
jgi:integrase/recombinase XerC